MTRNIAQHNSQHSSANGDEEMRLSSLPGEGLQSEAFTTTTITSTAITTRGYEQQEPQGSTATTTNHKQLPDTQPLPSQAPETHTRNGNSTLAYYTESTAQQPHQLVTEQSLQMNKSLQPPQPPIQPVPQVENSQIQPDPYHNGTSLFAVTNSHDVYVSHNSPATVTPTPVVKTSTGRALPNQHEQRVRGENNNNNPLGTFVAIGTGTEKFSQHSLNSAQIAQLFSKTTVLHTVPSEPHGFTTRGPVDTVENNPVVENKYDTNLKDTNTVNGQNVYNNVTSIDIDSELVTDQDNIDSGSQDESYNLQDFQESGSDTAVTMATIPERQNRTLLNRGQQGKTQINVPKSTKNISPMTTTAAIKLEDSFNKDRMNTIIYHPNNGSTTTKSGLDIVQDKVVSTTSTPSTVTGTLQSRHTSPLAPSTTHTVLSTRNSEDGSKLDTGMASHPEKNDLAVIPTNITSPTTTTHTAITSSTYQQPTSTQQFHNGFIYKTIPDFPTDVLTPTTINSVTTMQDSKTNAPAASREISDKISPGLTIGAINRNATVSPQTDTDNTEPENEDTNMDYIYLETGDSGQEIEEGNNRGSGGGGRRKNRNRDRNDRDRNERPTKTDAAIDRGIIAPSTTLSSVDTDISQNARYVPPLQNAPPVYDTGVRIPTNKSVTITPLATATFPDGGLSSQTIASGSGLSSGAEIGLVVVGLCLFWLVMIPVICLACRFRRKMRSKDRRSAKHNSLAKNTGNGAGDDMGAMLVEEMIRLELARGRDKLYRTDVTDVNEIERLPVSFGTGNCPGDYENLAGSVKLAAKNVGRPAIDSHLFAPKDTHFANMHGEFYDRSQLGSNDRDTLYNACDESRDTITSISSPILTRDPSQLTNFTGYRSHDGSVSVDSGFDNRYSMKHDNSNLSMAERSPMEVTEIMIIDKPVYKGYVPIRMDSSLEKSVDSSPAISGYANIRQLRREHESAGSLTNDTTSVDSTSFHDEDNENHNISVQVTVGDNGGFCHSVPRMRLHNQVLDPSKYLICNNHIGSLEKPSTNGRHSQHTNDGSTGECRCAFRASLIADENCDCRTPSSENLLDNNYPQGESKDTKFATQDIDNALQDGRILANKNSKNTLV